MTTYSQRILKGGRLVAWQRLSRFRVAQAAIRKHCILPVDELLDIGAADGIGLPFLKPLAKRVLSVNYYEEHTREFKEAHPDDEVITADARDLKISDCTFDVCTSFEALNCVATRNDRKKCISEIYRLLKPGGLFVCSVPIEVGYPALIKFVARVCTGHQTQGIDARMAFRHCFYKLYDIEKYDGGCHLGFNVYSFIDDVGGLFDIVQTKMIPIPILFPMNMLVVARRR